MIWFFIPDFLISTFELVPIDLGYVRDATLDIFPRLSHELIPSFRLPLVFSANQPG